MLRLTLAVVLSLPLAAFTAEPEKVLVLPQDPGHLRFVLLGEHVYLLGDGGLLRVPKAGGVLARVAEPGEGIPGQLLVANDTVHWTELGRFRKPCGSIRALAPDGRTRIMASRLQLPESLVVDGDVFFWLDWHDGLIRRGTRSRKVEVIGDAGKGLHYLGINTTRLVGDEEYFFYSSVPENPKGNGREAIHRIHKGGGKPTVLTEGQHAPTVLALDATHVYWLNEGPPPNSIRRVLKAGGKVEEVAPSRSTYRLLVEGGHLYWIDNAFGQGYALKRVPISGGVVGPVETIYSGKCRAYWFDLDQTHIYWLEGCGQHPTPPETVCTNPDGHLLRMRRP